MSRSPTAEPEQPHIVSLALQAKKALQQGQDLCLNASKVSAASARTAVDVLALDAQVRWMSEAVLDQLKVRQDSLYARTDRTSQWNVLVACGAGSQEHRTEAFRTRETSRGASPVTLSPFT